MTCHYCGAPLEGERDFCLCCGTRRIAAAPEPVAVEVPVYTMPEGSYFDAEVWDFQPAEQPEPAPRQNRIRAEEWNFSPDGPGSQVEKPRLLLPEGRSLTKMFFLGILTLGIYPTVIWSRMVTELNILASRYDGRRTMPYFAMVTLSPITLCVFTFVWMHRFCGRIEGELLRRDLDYRFGARDFWLWNILGSLILVGPFVFVHKLCKAMNLLNKDFNKRG